MGISHSIAIDAPRDVIFSVYEDFAAWPEWDGEVQEVYLPNGIQTGSKGWMRPTKGLRFNIQVGELVPLESFVLIGSVPLCKMVFGHYLHEEAGQIAVTHTLDFTGPSAFLFRRLIGSGLNERFPDTLAGLKRVSEDIVREFRSIQETAPLG